jgi:hypothetical protein
MSANLYPPRLPSLSDPLVFMIEDGWRPISSMKAPGAVVIMTVAELCINGGYPFGRGKAVIGIAS